MSSMAEVLPAPLVGVTAEELDKVEDETRDEVRSAQEAAVVAAVNVGAAVVVVAGIHPPILRASLTMRMTNTPLHS